MLKVIAYIDGFNLYYALRTIGGRRYYWLDLRRLAENLLRPDQRLERVHYFTSRVVPKENDTGKMVRQITYLEALETLPDLHVHYGYNLPKRAEGFQCGGAWLTYEEKMTDVNIAVQLVCDAYEDAFDVAILVSADSDLTRPVTAILERFPEKQVVVAFPPNRVSKQLRAAATASFTIGRKRISDSQLPDEIAKPDGYVLRRPERWR